MELLAEIFSTWSATVFTIIFFILFYYGAKRLLERQAKGKTDKKLIRSLILFSIGLFGIISVILALPMESEQKNSVTSLLGIVLSAVLGLSSTTFIGNALAGISLKLRHDFKPGDFIEINDIFGRVTEQGLFDTEVQTPNRDLTSIPNLLLATSPFNVTRSSGTILFTEVSLGYDVNRFKIEESLIKAAERAKLKDPFVLITALGDFSVVYRINGLLENVNSIITARSMLTGHVIDSLHEDGIEIVSPNFMNQRQVGDTVFIPKKHRIKNANMLDKTSESSDSLIFDKADEAENIEKRKAILSDVEQKISDEKAQLKEATTSEDKEQIQKRVDAAIALKKKLETRIDERVDKLSDS
jgi:small-conductance mechanosensitive channel